MPQTRLLAQFGVDLTARAAAGTLPPVIGRGAELEQMIQILCRRSKNNPALIGEPGVGKTALAEALAQGVRGELPPEDAPLPLLQAYLESRLEKRIPPLLTPL